MKLYMEQTWSMRENMERIFYKSTTGLAQYKFSKHILYGV